MQVFQEFDDAKADELVTSICNIVAVGRKVSVFNLPRSDGSDLDKAMLTAILGNMPTKPLQTGVEDSPINLRGERAKKQRSETGSIKLGVKQGSPFYNIYVGVRLLRS